MGVKGLFPWIKKNSPDSLKTKELTEYSKIGLDASLAMHRYARSQGDWLKGLIFQVRTMLENGVIPVYVMDGKPPEEKKDCIKVRKEKTKKAKEKDDGSFKSKCDTFYINDEVEKRFIKWCSYLGVECIKAPGEADPLLAKMQMESIIDAVWSEDGDILAYGCRKLVRKWKQNTVEEICLDKLLKDTKLSIEQFRKFVVFLGTDYAPRKYGPVKAIKNLCKELEPEYQSAYQILSTLPNMKITEIKLKKFNKKLEDYIAEEMPMSSIKYRMNLSYVLEKAHK